jgi:hypothetical protein
MAQAHRRAGEQVESVLGLRYHSGAKQEHLAKGKRMGQC